MDFAKVLSWNSRNKWQGYLLAVASSLAALLVRHLVVHETLHRTVPYLFFYFSLTASAWLGGLGPGLLATLLGFAAASGYLVKIQNLEYDLAAQLQAVVFVISGIFISGLFESLHLARRRLMQKMLLIETEVALRRKAQEKLIEADKNKNAFLATLAHELRGPLAAVSNALQLLDLSPEEKIRDKAEAVMKRQIAQMTRIVDDLLDTARVSENKIELESQPVLLSSVLQTALEGVRPLIDRSGHALSVTLGRQPLWVSGDPARLTQVFMNILANAAKYTDPQGRISLLAAQEDGAWVKIIIRDNGIGIAADVLPRIFDLYVQADAALAQAQGGLGIGLSLVRRLVSLHGGTVEARSAGIGKGSEFAVRLPALMRDAAGQPVLKDAKTPHRQQQGPVSGGRTKPSFDPGEARPSSV